MPEKENAGNAVRRFRLAGSYANVGLSRISHDKIKILVPARGERFARRVKVKAEAELIED
jgi:hypothetical protein